MPTGLTYEIAEGKATSLYEIITELMQGFMVDFRDGKLRSMSKVRADCERELDRHRESIQQTLDAIAELDVLSNQDLEDRRRKLNQDSEDSEKRYRADTLETLERYENAEALLVAWDPPASIVPMKEGMLRHLREQIEYEETACGRAQSSRRATRL